MLCLVTGVAGFVGSHLARRLLKDGYQVLGVDCFTDYYSPKIKWSNIADLLQNPAFDLIEEDLVEAVKMLPPSIKIIFHQSAQAGVRASWGDEFVHYTHHNVLATQRLLEWARDHEPDSFVYASSSSIYGKAEKLPMHEEDTPRPLSPYGVSKLAAEHLCRLYYESFGVPTVALRYFTIYGPAQRPDMAFQRFFRSIFDDRELIIYGNGEQTRDFTFIGDIVEANLAAAFCPAAVGEIYNIGGGSRISVNGALTIMEQICAKKIKVKHQPVQAGDPPHTYADTTKARKDFGYKPQIALAEGLQLMYQSLKD